MTTTQCIPSSLVDVLSAQTFNGLLNAFADAGSPGFSPEYHLRQQEAEAVGASVSDLDFWLWHAAFETWATKALGSHLTALAEAA